MRNVNRLRSLIPLLLPLILRMDTCNWENPPPLSPVGCAPLSCVFYVCTKKSSGTVITSKDIVYMQNLWHTLVCHLALGTIHLYLNIPVLCKAYCDMFTSLGSIIVIAHRRRHSQPRHLKQVHCSRNFNLPGMFFSMMSHSLLILGQEILFFIDQLSGYLGFEHFTQLHRFSL